MPLAKGMSKGLIECGLSLQLDAVPKGTSDIQRIGTLIRRHPQPARLLFS